MNPVKPECVDLRHMFLIGISPPDNESAARLPWPGHDVRVLALARTLAILPESNPAGNRKGCCGKGCHRSVCCRSDKAGIARRARPRRCGGGRAFHPLRLRRDGRGLRIGIAPP